MKYNDIPKPWKQRISGSINFYLTSYPLKDDLITSWIENRILKNDTGIYFVTSDPHNPEKFPLTDELFNELIEIFKGRFIKKTGDENIPYINTNKLDQFLRKGVNRYNKALTKLTDNEN
jgi:hypothetical protein